MFILTIFKDIVRIEPSNFRKPKHIALNDEINKKYANKVVQEVGLCVCVFDILEAGEGLIHHSDGCSYVKVRFRMVVFRPFTGEVLEGKIKSCTPSGITVSMGFFDDIIVPASLLKDSSEFDSDEQVWVWNYEGERMFMDVEEPCRFRVLTEVWNDTAPTSPPGGTRKQSAGATELANEGGNSTKIPPYSLTCSMEEDGLGLLSWWIS